MRLGRTLVTPQRVAIAGHQITKEPGAIQHVPLPVLGDVPRVVLDERKLPDRGRGEDRLGRRQRHVQERESVVAHDEARLRKREGPAREAEERVGRHRPVEIVGDEAEDHDVRSPRPHVAAVPEVRLVDAVAVDAEVEDLDVGAQRPLQPMAPGVLVAHLQAEREGIADDRDALARGAAREDLARP